MDNDSYKIKYGKEVLDRALLTLVSLELDRAAFIFPFGSDSATKEFIKDTLAFFKAERLPIGEDLLILEHQGCSIWPSILNAALNKNAQPNKDSPLCSDNCERTIVPILAKNFVSAAALPGTRPLIYHDYIQDVLENTTLNQLIFPSRTLLIMAPLDPEDPQFYQALARLGTGHFPYWAEGIGVDLNQLYRNMHTMNEGTYRK
jgi:hypothetical protein